MVYLRFYYLLAAVLWCADLQSQTPSYAHYGVKEGLPGNVVYCAAQDQRGFIWFGTDKGLARFDGVRFQTFGIKDGLPDPEVLSIFVDSQNRIWLSFLRQKPYYMKDGRVITAKEDPLLDQINLESEICDFAEDNEHRIWIMGRTSMAFIYDGKSVEKKYFPHNLVQIMNDGQSVLGLGLSSLMRENQIVFEFKPKDVFFKSVAFTGDRILYSLTDRLMLLDRKNGGTVLNSLFQSGGRVYTDRKGRFWACPTSGGAVCFDNDQQNLTAPKWYMMDKIMNVMFEDKSGTYWFCTSGDGIYALSPGKGVTFGKTDGFSSENITAITTDDSGRIITGDNLGNVYLFKGGGVQKMTPGIPGRLNRTRQIVARSGEDFWVGNDQGLFRRNRQRFSNIPNLSGLKGIWVEDDKVWYGTHARCGYFFQNDTALHVVVRRRTTTICSDDDRQIWIGGAEGVYHLRDSFRYNWGEGFPLLKNRIVTIQNAGNHQLWIVTPESGLLRATIKDGAIVYLEKINALLAQPIDNIQAVYAQPDRGNMVWLATNSGVYGVNPSNWQVHHLDQQDGLADNDVNCVLVNHDTLWAGTVSGLSFFPLHYKSNLNSFPSFITDLLYEVDNQRVTVRLLDSLTDKHTVIVPSGALMVTLQLTGLEYGSQGNFRYRCVIQKQMPSIQWWTRNNLYNWFSSRFGDASDTTFLQSNNLNFGITMPTGAYHVAVSAVTAQGIVSSQPDNWIFIIQPHWYNTIWVDLLIWAIIIYAIWRVIRARSDYRKLNIQVSELQLKTLQTQINPHFIGNSINTIHQFFYPPDRKGLSKYIQLFTQLLRRTILLSEQHFNRFEEEFAYDRDYLDMIKVRFKEQFSYEIIGEESIPSALLFPSMLLQPILENATIHGLSPDGDSHLILRFSYNHPLFSCSVIDNGIGYNAARERVSGHKSSQKSKGLELVTKKVEAFNQLYHLGLKISITDLADTTPVARGTAVEISFYPENIIIYEKHKNAAD